MGFLWLEHKNLLFFFYNLEAALADLLKRLYPTKPSITTFNSIYFFSYPSAINWSLSNKPCDISPLVADPGMQMGSGTWGGGDCASEFIWTDQKHNYALLAHNKPQLSGLEYSFIYINSVAIRQ